MSGQNAEGASEAAEDGPSHQDAIKRRAYEISQSDGICFCGRDCWCRRTALGRALRWRVSDGRVGLRHTPIVPWRSGTGARTNVRYEGLRMWCRRAWL
jgi:hypothetical protein